MTTSAQRTSNGFSKKLDNHVAAIALHFMYYNFVRIHQTLRVTPAMAAGVTSSPWEVADIEKLVEERQNAIDDDVDGDWKMGAESLC